MSKEIKKELKNELEQLTVVEAKELQVGNAFHAFRFSSAIEELDVVEANELKVGNAFHAFRFNA
ncbi:MULTISPECIES: hypothetical protein [Thermoactinomyces]|uniref:Uncharacterized protein n=1 Tax=Thermoactinomyces daqus TaxID=1329516 RepID=A0A7W2AHV2_9BACL|nr:MULTISPECIES: hypothetical protein [Thermoactinomyces]MBA4542099.1 hypothetical protein [Thermoactinomyces daqus]MBH8598942.1 hypothetical protein [Thermoactinomyces sp. CICC 10523]MBH8604928.1 hypothetical protein [Thermoactinomyces sp. CICC 10522]MBH8608356.1 hypothetical protein [Thermoactinomyces sp. CICC 10521]